MLINRFRFGYLRRLAWEGGDAYVPGAVWRTFSARNGHSTFEFLTRELGEKYFDIIKTALGGSDAMSTTSLPPVALYCLMEAKRAHGPKGVVELATNIAKDYRTVLGDLTKIAIDVQAKAQGWTQLTGNTLVDSLNLQIERKLSDRLGAIDLKVAQWRGGNPPGYDRYFTYFSKFVVKGATASAGAIVASALAGPVGFALGTVTGVVIGDALETRVLPASRRHYFGHVDAYRALDRYLTEPAVSKLHLPQLEAQVSDVLGMKLVH